jgi:LmbE family N-acetylglucosaminyl deacetylase
MPRRLYRRAKAAREAREEGGFRSRLAIHPDAPALLLSPHWDDAVLDCWTLLTGRRELIVIGVFAGVPAPGRLTLWDDITGARDSSERAQERIAEDAEALGRAGHEPVNLEFLDSQYRRPPAPDLDALDLAISGVAPRACRVFAPAGLGAHPDHLLTRRYARMLLRGGMPVTLYADLPYCILHGWPHWVDGREPDPHRNVDAFWLSFLVDVPEMPPLRSADVERLEESASAAKLEAMRTYRTQFASLNYGARELLTDPAIHGFEVHWDLIRPA